MVDGAELEAESACAAVVLVAAVSIAMADCVLEFVPNVDSVLPRESFVSLDREGFVSLDREDCVLVDYEMD